MDLELETDTEETDTDHLEPASAGTRAGVAEAIERLSAQDEVPEPAEPEPAEAAPAPEAAAEAPAAPDVSIRPPADWRPSARAEWAKLPRPVQEEAHRLHIETKRVLQESADARREAQAWREAVAPHEAMLRSEGTAPAEAFNGLLGFYARLKNGQLPDRVQIAADLIRQFVGTDETSITALANALAGAAPASLPTPAQASGIPHERVEAIAQERVQAVLDEMGRREALADWAAFEGTRPDLLPLVRNEIMTTAAVIRQQNGGGRLSVDDYKRAYDQACRLNPRTAPIIAQREAAEAAKKRAAEAPRMAAASSSIRSEPTGPAAEGSRARSTRDEVAKQFKRDRGGRV